MTKPPVFSRANTILYCQHWRETVAFYQHLLKLPVTYTTDWFVEFQLTETAYLSVADERQTRLKSSHGTGLTLTLQVEDIEEAWFYLHSQGQQPEPIRRHSWGARVFYFYDPEGYRLEIWSET